MGVMMEFYCALCMYVKKRPETAITVIDGNASCESHMGYLSAGSRLSEVVAFYKEQNPHEFTTAEKETTP